MKQFICIMCPKGCHLSVDEQNDYAVTGYSCAKGIKYGKAEATNPVRVVTSTVVVEGGQRNRVPVKTADGIPKTEVIDAMRVINQVHLKSPVRIGDVVVKDLLGTGVDVVATANM